MTRRLLRKYCPHCGKVFLTYDEDMEFCNSTCKVRHAYNDHFGRRQPKKVSKPCAFCGDEVRITSGSTSKRFCNNQCSKGYQARQRIKKYNESEKKEGHKMSYDALDKMEEKKRVFNDKHAEWYIRRGSSY